jgi:hypothetical protein
VDGLEEAVVVFAAGVGGAGWTAGAGGGAGAAVWGTAGGAGLGAGGGGAGLTMLAQDIFAEGSTRLVVGAATVGGRTGLAGGVPFTAARGGATSSRCGLLGAPQTAAD